MAAQLNKMKKMKKKKNAGLRGQPVMPMKKFRNPTGGAKC